VSKRGEKKHSWIRLTRDWSQLGATKKGKGKQVEKKKGKITAKERKIIGFSSEE